MINKMISHFFEFMFVPLEEQDFSEQEPLILYLSALFLSFLWFLYS